MGPTAVEPETPQPLAMAVLPAWNGMLVLKWYFVRTFSPVARPPLSWHWEGSNTPPGAAMVLMDRKDPNSNKNIIANFYEH